MRITTALSKSLPRPTDAQWTAFSKHLVSVHSWYKHLPLFDGGEFVIFLTPDAGESYPTQHPKLPTENTTEGYRQAFGHLDYVWRSSYGGASPSHVNEPFSRDGAPAPHLDDELIAIGQVHLFPFISHEFYWSVHKSDVRRIRNGAEHPYATEILHAYDVAQKMEQSWNDLTETDCEIISDIDDSEAALQQGSYSESILRYLHLEKLNAYSYRQLQTIEMRKLQRCITALRQWLESPSAK